MFKKMALALAALTIFMVVPTLAGPATGCNKIKFVGSYTRPMLNLDVLGDGTVMHSYLFQLNLHSDGVATQNWTGFPDYIINGGTGTPWTGSWTCRADGKLVVTVITGSFFPVAGNTYPSAPLNDIELVSHSRTTYLFSVDDANTLTRLQARTRTYGPNDDPTNAAGGQLGNLITDTYTYTRLVATDADLVAP